MRKLKTISKPLFEALITSFILFITLTALIGLFLKITQ